MLRVAQHDKTDRLHRKVSQYLVFRFSLVSIHEQLLMNTLLFLPSNEDKFRPPIGSRVYAALLETEYVALFMEGCCMQWLRLSLLLAGVLTSGGLFAQTVSAQEEFRYEITITNLTRGQHFTAPLVVTHKANLRLFAVGEPINPQLAVFAEEGTPTALAALLAGTPEAKDLFVTAGALAADTLLDPGKSATVSIEGNLQFDYLSLAAKLIPTNDAFIAINSIPGPSANKPITLFVPAYDAGSEQNDELCASIIGPNLTECGGPGGGGHPGGGEGFVYVHNGIHGVGNLTAAVRDWRSPVARIIIRRVDGTPAGPPEVDL